MTCMYRVQIIEEPDFESYYAFDEREDEQRVEWHRPVGWVADPDYIARFHTSKWFEPDTRKFYKSRSSAVRKAALLESMGYRVVVQRSAPVQWPAHGEDRIPDSGVAQVMDAIRVLREHGVIDSAEVLL